MQFYRVPSRLSTLSVCDPYTSLLHCKRTLKFLQQLRLLQQQQPPVQGLCVGSRHQLHVAWQPHFEGFFTQQQQRFYSPAAAAAAAASSTASILSSAPAKYAFILCLDPVLYAKHLLNINLPVIAVCSPREIHFHPEILRVIDYLLPSPSLRTDTALRQLLYLSSASDSSVSSSR